MLKEYKFRGKNQFLEREFINAIEPARSWVDLIVRRDVLALFIKKNSVESRTQMRRMWITRAVAGETLSRLL